MFCADLMYKHNIHEHTDEILNEALLYLQDIVERNGYDLADHLCVPKLNLSCLPEQYPRELKEETAFDIDALQQLVQETILKMNIEQRHIYETKEEYLLWVYLEELERHLCCQPF